MIRNMFECACWKCKDNNVVHQHSMYVSVWSSAFKPCGLDAIEKNLLIIHGTVWNLRVIMIYRHPFYCPVRVGTAFWPMIRLFWPTEGRFCAEVVSQGYKNLPLIDFRKCLSCSSLNNISAPWQHPQRVPNLPKNYNKISISLCTWKNSLKPCGLAFRSPCIPHWHSLSSFVPSLN